VDLERAEQWIDRWDAQQERYMPDREERFTVLIDAVEAGVGRDDPLVLDLGCGPGSLAVRLLHRMPAARVVAVDTDPLLLELGRAAFAGRSGLRFVDRDLRKPGWAPALGLDHRRLGDREHEEDWTAWWEAATADPELAGVAAERARRRLSEDHHGSESVLLIQHVAALRAAGFAEIGTLWQYGENRILCAVTPV
jgi:SAM-dependent methyltransferase